MNISILHTAFAPGDDTKAGFFHQKRTTGNIFETGGRGKNVGRISAAHPPITPVDALRLSTLQD